MIRPWVSTRVRPAAIPPPPRPRAGRDAIVALLRAASLGLAAGWSSCATPPSAPRPPSVPVASTGAGVATRAPVSPPAADRQPSSPPTLEECLAASGIYLAHVERADDRVRYVVTEVWRERQANSSVTLGAEILPPAPPRDDAGGSRAEQMVMIVFSPTLVRANGAALADAKLAVVDGNVISLRMSLDMLRARVAAPD